MIVQILALLKNVKAKEVSCETVGISNRYQSVVGTVKVCQMWKTTVIDQENVTIAINDESFSGVLFWRNKHIVFLPVEVSKAFPNLKSYEAGSCSIKTISKNNFEGLSKLKGLWLQDNQIKRISSETFEDLTSLVVLVLGKKSLVKLPFLHFKS
jgi:Leucine rich repeat